MNKMVTLTIDGQPAYVPAGTLIVDAAKTIGIDIPVFCYHPKLEPVGMCRMCLVEIGRPVVDRTTGEVQKNEDGTVKISFGPKLETACTTPVSEGMEVRGMTEKVEAARREMLEFLLTSHPLDCPICDKGGECPLQNLTLRFGPGTSRYLLNEKMRLAKQYPLGELIYLDRERCIQCARCIRFQDEIVDDPVIGFYQRGRSLEIISYSDPGFDSYFSGNTTDICPVGALTTTDFRFEARPWELNSAASICQHCPVGCNLTINVRREARSGGQTVIKRIMPRQNEAVNEIWMCDKGRWGYHFAQAPERLVEPLVCKDGELVPATYEEAFTRAAEGLRAAGEGFLALAGGRLSNEDLFNLRELAREQGGQASLYSFMAGGELTTQLGLPPGSNLKDVGKGATILVVACDLEEEAPIWWLRIKQAAERGATLIVANPRATKLDRAAHYKLRYRYGQESDLVAALLPGSGSELAETDEMRAVVKAFDEAENGLVIYGHEGVGLAQSRALADSCARLLVATGHYGKPNNGLLAAWARANEQGAWELGFRPLDDLNAALSGAKGVLIAAADPAGDDPILAQAIEQAGFVVVQELFLTETARRADVVLPVQSFAEREGSFTSAERRVQRFYPAGINTRRRLLPDYALTAQLGAHLGVDLEGRAPSLVMRRINQAESAFTGVTYEKLAETHPQTPIFGRSDLYYGGTGYANTQGVGVQLPITAQAGVIPTLPESDARPFVFPQGDLIAVPVDRLYDRGATLTPSQPLLGQRMTPAAIVLHPDEVRARGLAAGEQALVTLGGVTLPARVEVDETMPMAVALIPRSVGFPLTTPAAIEVTVLQKA
ncbi:MAG: NADH-quinone oxidoreductase subunit NuoG [Anaerolineaceae bacterium]|nr:NADH-quinone oxidoreductase subunit NuoG [Anaerolineaceae bacterium]